MPRMYTRGAPLAGTGGYVRVVVSQLSSACASCASRASRQTSACFVGDAAPAARLAPVPYQGIPDGDDSGGDGGRVDVVPGAIAPDVVQEPVRGARRRAWSPNASA